MVSSTLMGIYMADNLKKRAQKFENAIALITLMHDQLRFLQPSTHKLITQLCHMMQFAKEDYINICAQKLDEGMPFPNAWYYGIEKIDNVLKEILTPLADILGAQDLETQLNALLNTKALLLNALEIAREDTLKLSKLYTSLGFMCGLALAIILI